MIIQKIGGGLGNQMFQYAYAKATSLRNKTDFCLDLSWFKSYGRDYNLPIFDIEEKYTDNVPRYEKYLINKNIYINYGLYHAKRLFRLFNKNHHIEKDMFSGNGSIVDEKFLKYKDGYIEGSFQSDKYFMDFKDEIKKDFKIRRELSKKSNDILRIIEATNSVSVHIRRGDYLSKAIVNTFGILPKSYYEKGIKIMRERTTGPLYIFFFSDDINWVKNNFNYENSYYIDWNIGKDSRQDMILMSKCKNNIIANSSFSRRGAYLNENDNKIVIAPNKRFKSVDIEDIVPSDWMRI